MSNKPFFSDESVMPKLRKLLAGVVALSRQLEVQAKLFGY